MAEVRRSPTTVAQAWVNFARTGNPSQPGLEWKPYTTENPQAMVFDTISQSVALRDDKLVGLLPARAGRGGRGRGDDRSTRPGASETSTIAWL